ncbi:MAG: PAS domain-containing protein, partial [Planctomycetota bacterium]
MPDPFRPEVLERILAWLEKACTEGVPEDLGPPEEDALGPLVEGLNRFAEKLREVRRRQADATRKFEIHIDTSRKREKELEERMEEFRRLVEHKLELYFFYRHDTQGVFTYVSPSVEQVLGYSPEEFLTHYKEYTTDNPINEKVVHHTNLSIRGVKQPPYKVENLHKDGTPRILEVLEVPVFDESGRVTAVEGIARDVTALERALAALKESEERFKGVFDHAMIGLYRTTPEGRIVMANPALVRMLGYDSFEELAARNLEESGFEPDYPREAFRRRMEETGRVTGLESAWTKEDGSVVYVRESAVAVKDEAGKTLFYEGTVEDITLRREA